MENTIRLQENHEAAIKERLRRAEALLHRYRSECYDVQLDALTDIHFSRAPKEDSKFTFAHDGRVHVFNSMTAAILASIEFNPIPKVTLATAIEELETKNVPQGIWRIFDE